MQSSAQAKGRRRGLGVKVWLVVSETGQSHLEGIEKHSFMKRTGLPARDLRALDPVLSYPSSIFGRERAIVINLEYIKAVITATEVLLINSTNPLFAQFVQDLQTRVSCSTRAPHQMSSDTETESAGEPLLKSPDAPIIDIKDDNDVPAVAAPKVLPFEFRALEACLESACRRLEFETQTLEEEAYPALDELSSHISTLNLERVRQIKSRLAALSGRVQKVRDELENLLDDDNDMAEMYMTQKLSARSLDEASMKETCNATFEENDERDEDSKSKKSRIFTSHMPDVEELEMLLEAYFKQMDGASQKLSHMSEYVDDTEDYINIMLNDKQNQLLLMELILNTANMILTAGIVVVSLFGMNIHITLFDGLPKQFWGTAFGTVAGCIALLVLAVGWGKKRYLLPS